MEGQRQGLIFEMPLSEGRKNSTTAEFISHLGGRLILEIHLDVAACIV